MSHKPHRGRVRVPAGGTGSGKSSLVQQMAGADFSAVGVTLAVHQDPTPACGAWTAPDPLAEWLASRTVTDTPGSSLGEGEVVARGLILISTARPRLGAAGSAVEDETGRRAGRTWGCCGSGPAEIADSVSATAATSPRLAGHSSVIAVGLNSPTAHPEQDQEGVSDLTRCYDWKGCTDARAWSTRPGTVCGLDDPAQGIWSRRGQRGRAATRPDSRPTRDRCEG